MKWAKTAGNTILTIAVILVLLLGAGYIGLALYDWNNLKPRIAKALEDATGRKATIQGDVTLELDLSPTLGINDIKIQNADWGAGPTLMTIPHAELEIDLFSLLDQRTEIESIYLKQPALNLETSENGRLNIQPVSKKKEKDQQPANFFRKVRIENGDFRYHDHAMNKTFQGDLKTFTAQADSFDSPVRMDAVGTYSERDFSIDGTVGSQAGMLTKENAWRVDLKAKLGDAQAKADGIIPLNGTAEAGTLNISAEGDNLSELAALFGVSVPAEKPFQVFGKIARDPKANRWQVNGDARLGDMTFKADGSVAELTSLNGVKAEISAEGPNLSNLTALFGKSSTIEKPFDVTGTIAQNLKENQWQVDAKGTLGEMDVSVDGSLPQSTSLAGLQTDISVEGPNYANFMALFGVSVTVDDPFDLTGDFRYPDPDQRLRVEITGTIGEMTLALDGSLPGITEIEGLNTTISTKGLDFSKLMAVFTLDVPVTKAFDITTDFSYPDTLTYHMDKTRARIGDSDYTGRIRIDANEKPFSFIVDGTSEQLNLAAFIDNYREGQSTDQATDGSAGKSKQLIPDTSLPLDRLQIFNSEIHLKAATLLLPHLSLTDFQTEMSLQGGNLQINTLQSQVGTGTVAGRMEVRSDAGPPAVTAALNADGIQLNEMISGGDPIQTLQGTMSLSLDLSGRGSTYAELAADLTGKAGMTMSDGTLHYHFIRILGYNILSALIDVLNPFDQDREFVDVNCMVIRFDIEDGLAESTALILDTPEVAVIGDGKINLKTEEINIPLNTIPKKNIGIKNVVGLNVSLSKFIDPLQIDGTLSNPTVRIDVPSALFSIGKAIGGVAIFGPAGIAATLLSGSAGKQNICQAAFEKDQQSDQQKSSEAPSGGSKARARRSSEQESEQPINLKNLKVLQKKSQ